MSTIIEMRPEFEKILALDLPDIERLYQGYCYLLEQYIEITGRQIEIHKAVHDQEALLKEQIKAGTMQFLLEMFKDSHMLVLGKRSHRD